MIFWRMSLIRNCALSYSAIAIIHFYLQFLALVQVEAEALAEAGMTEDLVPVEPVPFVLLQTASEHVLDSLGNLLVLGERQWLCLDVLNQLRNRAASPRS